MLLNTKRIVYLFSLQKIMIMKNKFALILCIATFSFLMLYSNEGWNQNTDQSRPAETDTIPHKRDKKIKDLDAVLEELDRSIITLEKKSSKESWLNIGKEMKNIEKEMKNALKEIDIEKTQAEAQKAIRDIDVEKMRVDINKAMSEINKAMSEIDIEKMKVDVNKALIEADREKRKAEAQDALKQLDLAKIQLEIDAALAKVDMEKLRAEMKQLQETDMSKIQKELEKIQPEIEKSLKDAKIEIEKAKTELREYKSFIDGLHNKGIINKNGSYTIEHADGVLKINGKTQGADVYNQHKSFLQKHKVFTLKKDDDGFKMD